MRDLFSDDNLYLRLMHLLDSRDWRLRMYVYRLHRGQKRKPALYKGEPFPELFDRLRDDHGGGEFAILIRRGATMMLSGRVGVVTPLNRKTPL